MSGEKRPRTVLGICDSHDCGVAIIRGGTILAAVNEERLTRRKMISGVPRASLQAIWKMAGVSPREIDGVGLAGLSASGARIPMNNDFCDDQGRSLPMKTVAEILDRAPGGALAMRRFAQHPAYQAMLHRRAARRVQELTPLLGDLGVRTPVSAFDHHDCHAACAYFAGGRDDALVITNDGFGDSLCSKVQITEPGSRQLKTLSANSFYNSIGNYYNFVTLLCGFRKAHHAGKTTGLAAYGDPQRTLEAFRRMIRWDERLGRYVNSGGIFRNCLARLRKELKDVSREDLAAGIQQHLEDVLQAMARHYVAQTGRSHVVVAGGIHANVKANQRLVSTGDVESLFVFPHMGDGGLALGAAYLEHHRLAPGELDPATLESVYLGPQYGEREIADALSQAGIEAEQPRDMPSAVAAELAANRIVARFDGRMEYGPRALGNRSILYAADRAEVNGWLNKQLGRTEFMPFAPVMRIEDAPDMLRGYDARTAHTAEFMTITYDVSERCKREAPATVHVDGTARPQVLAREVNPGYYDILSAYRERTGLSVLVNTSFNMHEEPIVCTPGDAVRAFFDSGLDVLAIGPLLVRNPSPTREGGPGTRA